MTAFQVAKAECVNCDAAGTCAGIGIADDLSLYRFRQEGKCYLAEQPIKRCVHFEQCVVPLAQARLRSAATTAVPYNPQPHKSKTRTAESSATTGGT